MDEMCYHGDMGYDCVCNEVREEERDVNQMEALMADYRVTTKSALLRAIRDELNAECYDPADGWPPFTTRDAALSLDGMLEAKYQRMMSIEVKA
jgi:hypothetical protein